MGLVIAQSALWCLQVMKSTRMSFQISHIIVTSCWAKRHWTNCHIDHVLSMKPPTCSRMVDKESVAKVWFSQRSSPTSAPQSMRFASTWIELLTSRMLAKRVWQVHHKSWDSKKVTASKGWLYVKFWRQIYTVSKIIRRFIRRLTSNLSLVVVERQSLHYDRDKGQLLDPIRQRAQAKSRREISVERPPNSTTSFKNLAKDDRTPKLTSSMQDARNGDQDSSMFASSLTDILRFNAKKAYNFGQGLMNSMRTNSDANAKLESPSNALSTKMKQTP